jgi:hypothetical protein
VRFPETKRWIIATSSRPWVGGIVPTWYTPVLPHDAVNAAPKIIALSDVILNSALAPATRSVGWSVAKRATVMGLALLAPTILRAKTPSR